MLFGLLPLLLVGVGLTFLLDGGSDTDPPPEDNGELNLTPGDDALDMSETDATTVNAFGGDDTITSDEEGPLLLRLGEGNDTAELSNATAEVYGRQGDDLVTMTDGSLRAFLGLGDDTLTAVDSQVEAYGGGGDDRMIAADFDDTLDGGSGADILEAADGDDSVLGGFGNDSLFGGRGDDTLRGGQGADLLVDDSGDDLLIGDSGKDILMTDGRGDTLYGYTGDDTLITYSLDSNANDLPGAVLNGGYGNDELFGDLNSTMTGGEGQDDFTVVSEFGSPEDPAVITDFDPAENDRLFLTITPEAFGDPRDGVDYEVTRQLAADGSGAEVLVNGVVYVKLEGLTTLEGWTVNVRENFV